MWGGRGRVQRQGLRTGAFLPACCCCCCCCQGARFPALPRPAGLLPAVANVPRPAIRLSSLPGDGGAATPRGGLPAPRTSLFTTAVVGGSSQLLLPPSSQQQQQQQQGGAVRVLLAAPVVPRLALAGMGGFGDGATRSSSPSHPSSSCSAAAFAQAAWQPPQQSASARENEPDNRAHPAAAQGGGGGAGPHAPPPLHVPQDPCPARGSSRRGSRGWLLCCWRGTQARGSGGSTWQGAPGTSSIDGRGRASTERCCIPGEQAARNTRLHLCQRLVLLQTIPPPHTHSLLAVCSGRMIRRRTRWARNMRERRSEPAAVSSQQGARRSRRLSWIHQPPCSSSSSRSSSRSSSSPTWLQVVMLPSAARIPSSTGKAAASSTAQVCCGAVRCVATGWML